MGRVHGTLVTTGIAAALVVVMALSAFAGNAIVTGRQKGAAAGVGPQFHEAGDWPCIHHDSQNSDVLPDGETPVQLEPGWSALENASVLTSPVVGDNGRIYVTGTKENFSVDGRDDVGMNQSCLYALSADTGDIIWQSPRIRVCGMACAPLLIKDGDRMNVVVSCHKKVISFIDMGNYPIVRWVSPLRDKEVAISCHLYTDNASIVVGTDTGSIYLKAADDGRNMLDPFTIESTFCSNTPAVTGDGAVIMVGRRKDSTGVAWAVRPVPDGGVGYWEPVWTNEDDLRGGSQTSPTISAGGDLVYIGDGYGTLFALALADVKDAGGDVLVAAGQPVWLYDFSVRQPGLMKNEQYTICASVAATVDGRIGLALVPLIRDGDRPMYVAILQETRDDQGVRATCLYMEDRHATSGVAYSARSDCFYFTGATRETPEDPWLNKVFCLEWSTRVEHSIDLENPCLNNITLAPGMVIVPVFWGGLGDAPPVTTEGHGVHCFTDANAH